MSRSKRVPAPAGRRRRGAATSSPAGPSEAAAQADPRSEAASQPAPARKKTAKKKTAVKKTAVKKTAVKKTTAATDAPTRDLDVVAPTQIRIRGARTHNLQGVDLDLPRDRLVVITGPSGSGKSSLAFDTIFAEGQRRYVESLSVSARQFLAQLPKPDADLVEGLSPAVAIAQDPPGRNPRGTVGTVTEIYDFLRLLFARVGQVRSPVTGEVMQRHSIEDMVEATLALPEGARFSVLAPVVRRMAGDHAERLDELRRRGFVRVLVDDEVADLAELAPLDPEVPHDIFVYVDRLKRKEGIRARLADSIETAAGLSGGVVEILPLEGEVMRFSERYADLDHGMVFPELSPSLLSFNSPDGACPRCAGLGHVRTLDARLLVDEARSLDEGAIRGWPRTKRGRETLRAVALHGGGDPGVPWSQLPTQARIALLEGTGDAPVAGYEDRPFEGVRRVLLARLEALESKGGGDDDGEGRARDRAQRDELRALCIDATCPACEGTRLRPEARQVFVHDWTIDRLAALPLDELRGVVSAWRFEGEDVRIAEAVLPQVRQRLAFLEEVGLGYLALQRRSMTLSGGEAQRVRLATQVGAALVGVTYILDEPSIGLHPRDNRRLLDTLLKLRDLGNSLIVVEHDADTMRAADWLVDMGPGAGVYGGRVVAAGLPADVIDDESSLTGAYLSGRRAVAVPQQRRRPTSAALSIRGATGHNLASVDARIPLGVLTCVTGVSGSGKSSLVIDTLLPEAQRVLMGAAKVGLPHASIDGLRHLDKVIHVDQSPIGRSPRSNPATFTGIFADVRAVFAQLPEAKIRGYQAARFSFNVKGGRCETCQGDGQKRIEMHFLPDVYVTCRSCGGSRFGRETLAITMRGQSIADVLAMTVAEAFDFFIAHPSIRARLEVLRDVGLGYLTLGQSALTLSGGEAQRIKLSRELARKSTGSTLFVLDEPTTGLHFGDVEQLLRVLQRLVDEGNTVVVIEHDLDVIKSADHVVDLGPEGGRGGGNIVVAGPPEVVARHEASHTGAALRDVLEGD